MTCITLLQPYNYVRSPSPRQGSLKLCDDVVVPVQDFPAAAFKCRLHALLGDEQQG
jgi:hypothetical protein